MTYMRSGFGSVLSDSDITREIEDGKIYIEPYNVGQLQPSGYNLTPTRFIYSTKKKKLLPIIENERETYAIVDKNDTVLIRTRESIAVSQEITGAFYSKVKVVSEGFGHVSTTLDPNWEGQLLISLNNPTNKKLKFSIETHVYGTTIYNSFVTLEFSYLNVATQRKSDNPPGRLDILDYAIERNISLLKKGRVQELKDLVLRLHEQEKKTITTITLQFLNDEEREVWNSIHFTADKQEYENRKEEFLESKTKKYIRFVQKEFKENAFSNIEIINEFVEQKQKYLPYGERILTFIKKHLYIVISILLLILYIGILRFNWNAEGDSFKNTSFLYVTFIYILVPATIKFMDHK